MGYGTTRWIGRRGHTGSRRWIVSGWMATLVALALVVAVPMVGPGTAKAAASPRLFQTGYRLVSGDGGVFAFSAPYAGSAAADPTACPPNVTTRMMPFGTCWSMAATPSDQGYWILNAYTGAITPYGDAVSYGDRTASNTGGADLWPTSVAMAPTADAKGYWILNAGLSGLGTVQAFGDAAFYGDQSTIVPLSAPNGTPVGIVATPNAKGYWIVDSDGGVFAFGDAPFLGSMGDRPLNAPVVGMARTPDGGGYWLAGADGGVFAFGDATFGGSMAGTVLNAPVIGIAAEPFGGGYWLAGMDGGVFALGGAPFLGSMAGRVLNQPVLGISTPAGGFV
jgi:hypothetical protein